MGSFGIGIGEVLLILVVALLIFGPGKVPEIARGLGKGLRQFSKYSSGLTSEFRNEFEKELTATPDTHSESTAGVGEAADESGSAGTKTEGTESQNPN
jgi:TatA/E family protein of Tat protein translocase